MHARPVLPEVGKRADREWARVKAETEIAAALRKGDPRIAIHQNTAEAAERAHQLQRLGARSPRDRERSVDARWSFGRGCVEHFAEPAQLLGTQLAEVRLVACAIG